jgi:hypothetical protein
MFNWRRWFGPGLDGVLGRKVQRVLSPGVLVSMAAAVLFGIGWGVNLMLSAAMWQACDQVLPLSKALLHLAHAPSTVHLTCPHLQLYGTRH